MIPFGYVGLTLKRIGCPGEIGEQTGYSDKWKHGKDHPEYYNVIDGILTPKSDEDVQSIKSQMEIDTEAATSNLRQIVTAIETEQASSDFNNITPDQARQYIDNKFSAATTTEEYISTIKDILKKMVVYTLKAK